MVILFLSELQLGRASEPSNKAIFLWILGSSGQKSTLMTISLLFFKMLNEPRTLQIYFEPIFKQCHHFSGYTTYSLKVKLSKGYNLVFLIINYNYSTSKPRLPLTQYAHISIAILSKLKTSNTITHGLFHLKIH